MIAKFNFFLINSLGIGLTALLNANTVQAITLSFTPKGAQLDGDAILDLSVNPGDRINFDVTFNPMGEQVSTINYVWFYDVSELQLLQVVTQGTSFLDPLGGGGTIVRTGQLVINQFVDQFKFLVTNPTLAPRDGQPDFFIEATTANLLNDPNPQQPQNIVGTLIFPPPTTQRVEVQTPGCASVPRSSFIASVGNIIKSAFIAPVYAQTIPPDICRVPEPSSNLGILVIGTFGLLGATSTLTRKLKSSKSSEKETTKVS